MKNINYYSVQGWMVNQLELKGNNLQIFAIIYGFSQDGESVFTGSINYLCKWISSSRPTVIKCLKELTALGYIIKRQEIVNKVIFNRYKVNLQVVKNFNRGSKETLQGGSKETLPNNNTLDNKEYNNKKSKPKKYLEKPKLKRTKKKPLPDFYFQYSFFTKEFSEIWFKEFLPMKQRKKASTSERALKSQLKKIAQYSSNNYKTALEILTNSVDAGWSDVYPLKTNNKQNNNQTNNWGTHAFSDFRMDYSVLETKDQDGNIINPGVPYDER